MKKIKFTKIAYWDIEDHNLFVTDGELLIDVYSDTDIEEYGYEIIEEEMPWMVNGFSWELIIE